MNKDGSNPVREEAVVRAHAWAVRLWNERKISADFTSDDEAELVEMLLGFLAVAPYPEPAGGVDFAALKNDNYRLQSEKDSLRQQLNEERFAVEALGGSLRVAERERDDLRRQLAEAQADGVRTSRPPDGPEVPQPQVLLYFPPDKYHRTRQARSAPRLGPNRRGALWILRSSLLPAPDAS